MKEGGSGNIYLGASGIVLPVANKSFYPLEFQDKSRLVYYASLFNTIEINSSFYKLPQAATVKKWNENVPGGFRFTYKLWKQITHNKGMVFDVQDIYAFFNRISGTGGKKGCILVQFAPSVDVNHLLQFQSLLGHIQEANQDGWRIAVEFRHTSWYLSHVYEMLVDLEVSLVIQDLPASRTPLPENISDFLYVRFHGPNGGYRGSYDDAFLYEYATYIHDWRQAGADVFVYFNNTMGNAVGNLQTLGCYLQEL